MLERLFPDGPDEPPRLRSPRSQSYALNALAQGYQFSGRPGSAVPLLQAAYDLDVAEEDKSSSRVDLCNLSDALRFTGGLRSAEASARSALILSRELSDRFQEGVSLQFIGLALATRGAEGEGEAASRRSLRIWIAQGSRQGEGLVNGFLAELVCWAVDPTAARPLANRAWDLAAVQRQEVDFIRAARLQGTAALLAQDFANADERLHHALRRARACHLAEEELPALVPKQALSS